MNRNVKLEIPPTEDNEESIDFETFHTLCEEMAAKAGVTMLVTETAILFGGVVQNVDLKFSISEELISIRSREYCPGYDGSPDARSFIIETIQDHIEIAQGVRREGPDWRELLDREQDPDD